MKVKLRKIEELKAAEYNPRLLTLEQEAQLTTSIEKFGLVEPLIVNQNSERMDVIVGGHQRLKVWQKLGNTTIPCVYVNLNLPEEKELNVRLNKNTGQFDWQILQLEFEKLELALWGFNDEDFPKIPQMTDVAKHTRKKVGDRLVLEIKCNTAEEANTIYDEMLTRGYSIKLK